MRRLRDTVAVNCPIDQAPGRIERFFAARRGADGTLRLPLRLPFGRPSADGFALDHEVYVDARVAQDDQNLNDLIRVSWKAESEIPLPSFSGTLVTWSEGNPKLTFIELDGTYVAPDGAAGAIFDETLGRIIAQRTAKDLLAQIASAIADAPAA
jgi:hypothetical protein